MAKDRLGFIGIGIMGEPMVRNLLNAGYEVTVNSRTKSKADKLLTEGAKWADTPAAVAQVSDVVITCVTDTPDVKNVLLDKDGVIEAARPGLICVDMSTISPKATREMAAKLAEKQVTLIDAPISGGEIGAIKAILSIMAGGDKATFEKINPILKAMGKTITYCGQSGNGQMTKLTNQVMGIHTVMSMAEGLAFARKAGLNLETTWQATQAGAAGSNALTVLGRKVIDNDFEPAFMVDLQQKDLKLVLECAEEIGQPLPGIGHLTQLLGSLQAKGMGKKGTQALYKVIANLAD